MAKVGRRLTVVLDDQEVDEWIRRTNAAVEAVALDFVKRSYDMDGKPFDLGRVSELLPIERSDITRLQDGTLQRQTDAVNIDLFYAE